MNDYQFFPVGSTLRYTADFSDAIPAGRSLTSVSWGVTPQTGSPLAPSLSSQLDDLGSYQSSILVTGCAHGGTYVLQATGSLSDGQTVTKDIALVGLNA
jgi:hypothetical protein